jgi:hypothetical protein
MDGYKLTIWEFAIKSTFGRDKAYVHKPKQILHGGNTKIQLTLNNTNGT